MAKSDRCARQRSWPLLYSISFLKPQLWVSLAECCNFFHIPQLQSNSYIVTCWEGGLQGLVGAHKVGLIKHTHPPLLLPGVRRILYGIWSAIWAPQGTAWCAGSMETAICILNGRSTTSGADVFQCACLWPLVSFVTAREQILVVLLPQENIGLNPNL